METTKLYVDFIIIGFETSTWITLLVVYFTDFNVGSKIIELMGMLPIVIFLLGIFYILGVIADRCAEFITAKVTDHLRGKSGLIMKSTFSLWEDYTYFNYARTKIRMLRASFMNFPIITVSLCLFTMKYATNIPLLWFEIIMGSLITVGSFVFFWRVTKKFYRNARTLEIKKHGIICKG